MKKIFENLLDFVNSLQQFLTRDIWRLDFNQVSRLRGFFYRQIMVAWLVGQAFIHDRLLVRASALVYATLLSIVPLLAVMFSLLKGFGIHNKLAPTLQQVMAPLGDQAIEVVVPTIVNFVDNVNVGALGAVGVGVLMFSVLSIITNIERAFNDIWKIKQVRSYHRRFSDYLSVLLLGPLLVFTVLGITASLQSNTIVQTVSEIPMIDVIYRKFAPIAAGWLAFFFLYIFIPNTKVRPDSAIIGAVLAGTLWQVANVLFADFVVSSYTTGAKAALYAGFATLPLFLMWLFISWSVVLLGAEISYAHQNVNKLTWEVRKKHYSQNFRAGLALEIILLLAEKFHHGSPMPTSSELADSFDIPERLCNEQLNKLLDLGLIFPIEGENTRYTIAKSPDTLTVGDIFHKLQTHGVTILPAEKTMGISKIVDNLQKQYDEVVDSTFGKKSLLQVLIDHKIVEPAES